MTFSPAYLFRNVLTLSYSSYENLVGPIDFHAICSRNTGTLLTGKRTLGQQHLHQGGGEHGEPGGGEARHGGGDDGEGQEGLGVLQPLAVRSRLTNLQCFTT